MVSTSGSFPLFSTVVGAGFLLDRQKGDEGRAFWLPLHKLFSGAECVAGQKLKVELGCAFRNAKVTTGFRASSSRKMVTLRGSSVRSR